MFVITTISNILCKANKLECEDIIHELQFQTKHNFLSFLLIYVRGKIDRQSAYYLQSMIY